MLSSQQKEDIARNRHIVKEIIDVLILCCCQNIAIRGGGGIPKTQVIPWQFCVMCPNTTKYYNPWIIQYLINTRIKYKSPDIQNKIIEISGEIVGD